VAGQQILDLPGHPDARVHEHDEEVAHALDVAVTLTDPGPDLSDLFAGMVAVSGTDVFVAAWGTSSRAGVVYLYRRGTSGWSTTPSVTLDDPAATAQDEFGTDVAASGTTLVVGTAGPRCRR
jgi:hypothetical protein